MSYKHKYYKYKQKYMNLLYGGANNKIVIRHKESSVPITSLSFCLYTDYVYRNISTLPLVQTMGERDKSALEQLLSQALVKKQENNIQELDRSVRELQVKIDEEEKKDKENINPLLLYSMKKQYQALLQQKKEIGKANKINSDKILHFLLQYFIQNYYILIDGIHNYTFDSYVSIGGQGIVFRIIKQGTGEHHIIKFAIYDNCDEIKHEAETLEKYYETHGVPTTFRPYKPLLYYGGSNDKVSPVIMSADTSAMDTGVRAMDTGAGAMDISVGAMDTGAMDTGAMGVGAMGVGAMGVGAMGVGVGAMGVGVGVGVGVGAMDTATDVRSMCFAIYEDVGNEDLLTFIRNCNALRTNNPSSQELVDRIRMIPHILLQIALQLDYYKHYRHNDIRLENIVVDVIVIEQGDPMGQDEPVGPSVAIYKGDALKLVRVTIIDFGKFDKPENVKVSLAYISSPEALEQEFMGTFKDRKKADLIGFCWVAIDLLTLSQAGYSIMEKELITKVLSNEHNKKIITSGIVLNETIKRKALLFIYQLLMHYYTKSPMSEIFNDMVNDTEITFHNLVKLIFPFKNDKIKEILFQNDNTKYITIINELIKLLFPIYTPTNINKRTSINEIIKWLHKQFPVLKPIPS